MSGKRKPSLMQRLLREHTLYRYLTAMEEGEIETIIAVMQQAADDAVLAQMIFEIHEEYQTEEELLTLLQEEESMEEKYGTIQSQPNDEDSTRRKPKRSRRPVWLQALAAVLLVGILGGSFFWIQLWRNPHTSPSQVATTHQSGWCVVPSAPLNDSVGQANLNAVAATSGNDVWAVGAYGTKPLIEHWNGQRWGVSALPASLTALGGALYSIAVLAPDDIWAVGASSNNASPRNEGKALGGVQPLIIHWDGKQWKAVPSPALASKTGSALNGVAALTTNDIWAVGSITTYIPNSLTTSTLIEHWDGQQWSVVTLPATLTNGGFNSVTAIAKDDVWAVGDTGTSTNPPSQNLIAHWDGQQWSSVPNPNKAYTDPWENTSASSANDVWTVSFPDVIEHWNGQQWQVIQHTDKIPGLLYFIDAIAPNNVWAVGGVQSDTGSTNQPAVGHWDGKNWNSIPQPRSLQGTLSSITSAGNRLWAVGTAYNNGFQLIASTLIESNICSQKDK